MVRQWNSLSDDCVTSRSTISMLGFSLSHRVMFSPMFSRSRASVVEKTFTPVKLTDAAIHPPSSERVYTRVCCTSNTARVESVRRHHLQDFLVGECPRAGLGPLQDRLAQLVVQRDPALLAPEAHVAHPAHVADFDHLLLA